MDRRLIFGIGLAKTGTSSLAHALEILGFPCLHSSTLLGKLIERNRESGQPPLFGVTRRFSAFCDWPIYREYIALDRAYPNSYFIYTVRDIDEWIRSWVNHFGAGTKNHRRRYLRHDRQVRNYFAGRNNWLVYDLCGGIGWRPLCRFLDCPVPDEPFPWQNRRKYRI